MQTHRCATCGEDWWDAHVCPKKNPQVLGTRIDFPSIADRAAWLKANMPPRLEACACIGPQNGQPRCPCAMRGVIVRDGRYIQPEQDLGPVEPRAQSTPQPPAPPADHP